MITLRISDRACYFFCLIISIRLQEEAKATINWYDELRGESTYGQGCSC